MKLKAQKDEKVKGNSVCVFDIDTIPHKYFGRHQLFFFNEFIKNEKDVTTMCEFINENQKLPQTINEVNNILNRGVEE